MKRLAVLLVATASALAVAQTPPTLSRIRGTLQQVDAHALVVRETSGAVTSLPLPTTSP